MACGARWKKLNSDKPLWLKPKEDISTADYVEFFQAFTGQASATPLMKTHGQPPQPLFGGRKPGGDALG